MNEWKDDDNRNYYSQVPNFIYNDVATWPKAGLCLSVTQGKRRHYLLTNGMNHKGLVWEVETGALKVKTSANSHPFSVHCIILLGVCYFFHIARSSCKRHFQCTSNSPLLQLVVMVLRISRKIIIKHNANFKRMGRPDYSEIVFPLPRH